MNKKVKFIYNPYSGEHSIVKKLDTVITMHQEKNLTIVPYSIVKGEGVEKALEDIDESYEYILLAGGDGTIDSVVNTLKAKNIDLPIGILPVGTANDFAKFLGLPNDIESCLSKILELKPKDVDLGKVNNKYFINVLSTGLFTDISQKTEEHLKNSIGKLAYYIKGIEELHKFRKISVKVTTPEKVYDEPIYLMLVFNGRTAGNFNLATMAEVDDGLLDVVIFKAFNIPGIVPIFIRILRGEHLDDPRIEFFKTDRLLIETNEDIVSDIDGEKGPDFPLEVTCVKSAIQVLGIK